VNNRSAITPERLRIGSGNWADHSFHPAPKELTTLGHETPPPRSRGRGGTFAHDVRIGARDLRLHFANARGTRPFRACPPDRVCPTVGSTLHCHECASHCLTADGRFPGYRRCQAATHPRGSREQARGRFHLGRQNLARVHASCRTHGASRRLLAHEINQPLAGHQWPTDCVPALAGGRPTRLDSVRGGRSAHREDGDRAGAHGGGDHRIRNPCWRGRRSPHEPCGTSPGVIRDCLPQLVATRSGDTT